MISIDQDEEDIKKWLALQAKQVQKEVEIICSENIDQNYMLHIDKKSPKVFVPQLSRRAAMSENNTTPRVCVSPVLLGCLIGYSNSEMDFYNGTTKTYVNGAKYRGGYEISELEFVHCIKPTDKLVFDASRTLEHWLVTYNQETIQYKSREIGKVFISSIASIASSGNEPKSLVTMYISHNKPLGINFSPKIFLKPGYYKVEVLFDSKDLQDVNREEDFKVKSISENEFNEAKGLSASLLNYNEVMPFTGW